MHLVTASLGPRDPRTKIRTRGIVVRAIRPTRGGPMRRLPFVVVMCCAAMACTADHATAPSSPGRLPVTPNVASGEGGEASANARLDLRDVRAELLAVDRAYAEAAKSANLIDAPSRRSRHRACSSR